MDRLVLSLYSRKVPGVEGNIATVLLDQADVKELGQEAPSGVFRGGRGLFAVQLTEGARIKRFVPLEFDEADYVDGKIDAERRDRRAARVLGLLE